MKKRMVTILVVMAFMLAITPTSPAFARHPEIERALSAIHAAKDHLEHAAHDFGGHRVDALRALDEADRQLRICLQY
jgi:hypothetical protein